MHPQETLKVYQRGAGRSEISFRVRATNMGVSSSMGASKVLMWSLCLLFCVGDLVHCSEEKSQPKEHSNTEDPKAAEITAAADGVSEILDEYGKLPEKWMEYLPIQIATVGVFVTLILMVILFRNNTIGMYMLIGIVGALAAVLVTVMATHFY